jgi:hypothetical protein
MADASSNPTAAAGDDDGNHHRRERRAAFLRRHVLPRLKGWRVWEDMLYRYPVGDFLCLVSIDLDDAHRVVGRAEAGALFTDGVSAGARAWRPRAKKPDARVRAVLGIAARAERFFNAYATPLRAARWLSANPSLDPMEGEVTALTWALAGRPREALDALSRAIAYGDTIENEHVREFNEPILEGLAGLRRDLQARPESVRTALRRQVRRQRAEYRKSGVV